MNREEYYKLRNDLYVNVAELGRWVALRDAYFQGCELLKTVDRLGYKLGYL